MTYEELKGLFISRTSTRRYLPDPIPEEDIREITDAAHHAPSAHNQQPWRVLALVDKEIIKVLAKISVEEYQKFVLCVPVEEQKILRRLSFFVGHFAGAPAVLIILSKKSETEAEKIFQVNSISLPEISCFDQDSLSVGAFIQNLLLAAEAMGYATCWMAAPVIYAQDKLEKILHVVEPWHIVSIIALGKSDTKKSNEVAKKGLAEILTFIS
jgi:nitroreductase